MITLGGREEEREVCCLEEGKREPGRVLEMFTLMRVVVPLNILTSTELTSVLFTVYKLKLKRTTRKIKRCSGWQVNL